ncbi:hypothetical protein GQ457_03G043400 [Hibiscus cannabinus]
MVNLGWSSMLKLDIHLKLDEILFVIKLQTLFWFKMTKDDWCLLVDEWWENPKCDVRGGWKKVNQSVVWVLPASGTVKFNVDGISKDELAGCRGVHRCDDGMVRSIFSGLVVGKGMNFAKLSALK